MGDRGRRARREKRSEDGRGEQITNAGPESWPLWGTRDAKASGEVAADIKAAEHDQSVALWHVCPASGDGQHQHVGLERMAQSANTTTTNKPGPPTAPAAARWSSG